MAQPALHGTQQAAVTEPGTQATGLWRRAATPLGPISLRMAYHAHSTEAIYELVPNHATDVPIMQGTGTLTEGIHAHAETDGARITLQIYLDNDQHLRYIYELTSHTNGQLRCLDGTLATLGSE